MALIAFCAIALVENVTNAHPVRRGREGWRDSGGGGVGGGRREDKKEQKQDKRVGHVVIKKNPKQRLIQRTAHRQTTVFSVAVETTSTVS